MTVLVNFLPPSYGERQRDRRDWRSRWLLAVLIATGVLATEVLLRRRIAGIERMAALAEQRSAPVFHRSSRSALLEERHEELAGELGEWLQRLRAPRATVSLDAILMARPQTVVFRNLEYRVAADGGQPFLQVDAVSADVQTMTAFLEAANAQPQLPELRVTDSQAHEIRGEVGRSFRLVVNGEEGGP